MTYKSECSENVWIVTSFITYWASIVADKLLFVFTWFGEANNKNGRFAKSSFLIFRRCWCNGFLYMACVFNSLVPSGKCIWNSKAVNLRLLCVASSILETQTNTFKLIHGIYHHAVFLLVPEFWVCQVLSELGASSLYDIFIFFLNSRLKLFSLIFSSLFLNT